MNDASNRPQWSNPIMHPLFSTALIPTAINDVSNEDLQWKHALSAVRISKTALKLQSSAINKIFHSLQFTAHLFPFVVSHPRTDVVFIRCQSLLVTRNNNKVSTTFLCYHYSLSTSLDSVLFFTSPICPICNTTLDQILPCSIELFYCPHNTYPSLFRTTLESWGSQHVIGNMELSLCYKITRVGSNWRIFGRKVLGQTCLKVFINALVSGPDGGAEAK